MQIINFLNKLRKTSTYKKFKEEHPESYFSIGFFILDLKSHNNIIQLDFFLPKEKKLASFEYPSFEFKIHEERVENLIRQSENPKIDIKDLEGISREIIQKNNSSLNPTKIIAILKGDEWNLTCMDGMLGIIKIKVNAITGEEISFGTGSFMDMIKIKKPSSKSN